MEDADIKYFVLDVFTHWNNIVLLVIWTYDESWSNSSKCYGKYGSSIGKNYEESRLQASVTEIN